MVPFVDMWRMHEPLAQEMEKTFSALLRRSAFVNGPEVRAFEESFAQWVGTDYCLGFSSGLDAEVVGLRAAGLKTGDRIVSPAMTFMATNEAITWAGGVPHLVDVDDKGLLDLNQVEAALKDGVRWIFPVHLFGELAACDELVKLADRYGARIFEDACQAHGAVRAAKRAGSYGVASAFSFYPGKNLGALGDGGALCTNDPKIIEIARALREHGQTKKYYHEYEGYTARLDNIQAAFLSAKLKHMDEWNRQRIAAAQYYGERLQGLSHARLQSRAYDGSHVYHLYVVLTDRREELSKACEKAKIGYGYHYPISIPNLACYKDRPWAQGTFPKADYLAQHGISLPIFPGITTSEMDEVIAVVKSVCA